MVLPPMFTFPSCSFRAPEIILSRKLLKRVGEKKNFTELQLLFCTAIHLNRTYNHVLQVLNGAN